MNITLELQELDDLIVKHTAPPVTTVLRNKLHPLREQIEAYIEAQDKKTAQHALLAKEYEALKLAHAKTSPNLPADSFEYRRGLYYRTGDAIPFCAYCWETAGRKIHLSGPIPSFNDKTVVWWECHACNHDYHASENENFRPRLSRRRTRPR